MTLLFTDWKLDAALGSCLLLGLRHGFDYDHLAAISDITAVQQNWRSGLRLGMTYALGHAFTVAARRRPGGLVGRLISRRGNAADAGLPIVMDSVDLR